MSFGVEKFRIFIGSRRLLRGRNGTATFVESRAEIEE
jgi:hypothetical protein